MAEGINPIPYEDQVAALIEKFENKELTREELQTEFGKLLASGTEESATQAKFERRIMNESKAVYILTNPAMPGLVKIGIAENLEQRVKELSRHSGVPISFEVYYACELVPNLDPVRVEKGLHGAFGDHRVNPKREFFRISPERVVMILKTMELNDVTPSSDNYLEDQEEKKSLDKEKKRRTSFTFSSAEIPVGSVLTFVRDEKVTATVMDDRNVEFEGEITSLSTAAGTVLMRDHGWTYSAVQGPAYWLYENEILTDRRDRIENRE